jgi:hypothetical protein
MTQKKDDQQTPLQTARALYWEPKALRMGTGSREYSKKSVYNYRRMLLLLPEIASILTIEEAPMRIWRWVAWGKIHEGHAVRLALAMHLRREARDGGWAWPEAAPLGEAERVWTESGQHARLLREGLLTVDVRTPSKTLVSHYTGSDWDRTWSKIQDAVAETPHDTFWQTIDRRLLKRPQRAPPILSKKAQKEREAKKKERPRALDATKRAAVRAFKEALSGDEDLLGAIRDIIDEKAEKRQMDKALARKPSTK